MAPASCAFADPRRDFVDAEARAGDERREFRGRTGVRTELLMSDAEVLIQGCYRFLRANASGAMIPTSPREGLPLTTFDGKSCGYAREMQP